MVLEDVEKTCSFYLCVTCEIEGVLWSYWVWCSTEIVYIYVMYISP